jgi:gluconate 2-dehydrogenase gamma chain
MHGRNYRSGPWHPGTPQQGFQSRLTPQEIYRFGIAETDAHCKKRYGKAFRLLTAEQQDEVLKGLEKDAVELPSLPAKLFFGMLWRNTEEGFFSDPMYGGNRDKAGWRLLGFPGVAASNYGELLYSQTGPYRVEPVSILDIETGRAKLDNQGYPKHQPVKAKN